MKVLFIVDYLPYPPNAGDRLRVYNLIRRIARQHEVSLAAFLATPEQSQVVGELNFCRRVETALMRRHNPLVHLPGIVRFMVAGRPPELKFLYRKELGRKVAALAASMQPDIVHVENSRMALYQEVLPQELRARKMLALQNLTSRSARRSFHIERNPVHRWRYLLDSWMMRRWEPLYAGHFGRCATVSEVDRELLLAANPSLHVEVVPNGVDTRASELLPPPADSHELLLVGLMSYLPNSDAAVYFHDQILPRIRTAAPDTELWIVGKDPPVEVAQLQGATVHVTGTVPDVTPYYLRSSVCIVPLRAGGGTRLKILEAMALGRPVVSTRIGCEGLDVIDGEHLLVADDPQQFAEMTLRLLRDGALYQRIVENARKLVVERYDWDAIADRLLGIYTQMLAEPLSAKDSGDARRNRSV